jgi:hypothetical protein
MATPPLTRHEQRDDLFTVAAISALAAILASITHEGLGHAAIALATGAKSGLLTAVAWSSESDSRLVSAGGHAGQSRRSVPPLARPAREEVFPPDPLLLADVDGLQSFRRNGLFLLLRRL